jgi:argininosuccinate synthase
VGIVDQIEDRVVGLKVRDLYETPAAAILLPAHRELESWCRRSTRTTSSARSRTVGLSLTRLWHELRLDLDACIGSANELVSGEVAMRLCEARATPLARARPTLYDALASSASRAEFSQAAAQPSSCSCSRMAHRIRAAPRTNNRRG